MNRITLRDRACGSGITHLEQHSDEAKAFLDMDVPDVLGCLLDGGPVKPVIVTQTRVEVSPAAGLLQPCEEPPLPRVETVRDVLNQTLAWRLAYEHCAAQVRCVAAWVRRQRRAAVVTAGAE
ncbi:hypothetical protein LOK82_09770 [Xylella fastidiosa subsp. multiplex]|uniref:Uncharacterized protein n=1 Tax=Xylella fastidiosa subsp. multiplex TaxID=644357 RepID=A0AAW6HVT0_XYLFS|nr:hypothetical protein [Xylella fastidiosa subsp. multiplex]